VQLHCPADNKCPKSEAELQSFFSGVDAKDVISHEFCDRCKLIFEKPEETNCKTCGGLRYLGSEGDQHKKIMKTFFLEFPFETEITRRFQGSPLFFSLFSFSFSF